MHLKEILIEPEFTSISVMKNFHDINNAEDFWMWVDEVFVPGVMPDRFLANGTKTASFIEGGIYIGKSADWLSAPDCYWKSGLPDSRMSKRTNQIARKSFWVYSVSPVPRCQECSMSY